MTAERRKGAARKQSAAFAFESLDRVLHERARLSILSALLARPNGCLFNDLKELCALTDGNLARHLQVLTEARLVEVWKGRPGRRPQTLLRLTAHGRREFLAYIDELERVVQAARSEARANRAATSGGPPGFQPA